MPCTADRLVSCVIWVLLKPYPLSLVGHLVSIWFQISGWTRQLMHRGYCCMDNWTKQVTLRKHLSVQICPVLTTGIYISCLAWVNWTLDVQMVSGVELLKVDNSNCFKAWHDVPWVFQMKGSKECSKEMFLFEFDTQHQCVSCFENQTFLNTFTCKPSVKIRKRNDKRNIKRVQAVLL